MTRQVFISKANGHASRLASAAAPAAPLARLPRSQQIGRQQQQQQRAAPAQAATSRGEAAAAAAAVVAPRHQDWPVLAGTAAACAAVISAGVMMMSPSSDMADAPFVPYVPKARDRHPIPSACRGAVHARTAHARARRGPRPLGPIAAVKRRRAPPNRRRPAACQPLPPPRSVGRSSPPPLSSTPLSSQAGAGRHGHRAPSHTPNRIRRPAASYSPHPRLPRLRDHRSQQTLADTVIPRYRNLDANKDGLISRAELAPLEADLWLKWAEGMAPPVMADVSPFERFEVRRAPVCVCALAGAV